MAAAVVAAHGSNWRPVTSSSSTSNDVKTSASSRPPYSPRSSLLSPVKFGDQLQPYKTGGPQIEPQLASTSSLLPTTSSNSSYASYRLPTYNRENLLEKLRQEAWVSRRISDLTREGLWSDKRLPKVCERPRPRSHWDSVLHEMQWLSVDFHEERQWKKCAAKILAYSAKKYVEEKAEREAKKRHFLEKKHRKIAKFMADQVDLWWQTCIFSHIHSEKKSDNSIQNPTTENILLQGEASSESGVCNLDEETDEELLDSGKN